MTPTQRRLVRDSFELLRQDSRPLTLLFYGKLFELDRSARRLFYNDIAAQGEKLMNMLTEVIEALDDFEAIRSRLGELGRRHAGYGVRLEQYETLTTALLWAIAQALEGDFDPPTKDAWRLAITSICDAMKAGLD